MRLLFLPVTLVALLALPSNSRAAESVALPAFRAIDLRGGGQVVVLPGASQRVTLVEGNSRLTRFSVDRRGRLMIDGCRNNCPRSYKLRIEIRSPRMPDAAISGGGSIRAAPGFRGQDSISAAIHGGGKIDLRALDSRAASIAVVGGGEVLVRARASLSAVVTGGGAIRYWGNPQVSSVIRGGGWISRGS
jgi:hypothetical protein